MTRETLEALFEKAPETFLRALDACHQLAGRGFEPTAIDVRKALGNRGSLEVIQAAVKRYRELSGYVGVETLLPVTLANDLVIAAEAVFQRYQKREAARLDTLTGTYDTSLESLATELQTTLQNNAALQAQMVTLERERDAAQQEAIKKEEEGEKNKHYYETHNDVLGSYTVKKKLKKLDWKLTKETKTIEGILCYKATADEVLVNKYGEFKYPLIAWYAPSIPVNIGPLGISGLPGLILEYSRRNVVFGAIKISINPKTKPIINKPKFENLKSEEEVQKLIDDFMNDKD